MLKILIILIIAIIVASLLFTVLKKAVRLVLFVGLVIIVFIVITNLVYPETDILEKGKNYILGKTESLVVKGKDTLTSYVILEANQTINKAKEKVIGGFED